MHSKKGQGLSLTTIIVAAIALIVLVVLVMIFTGRIGIFSGGVDTAGNAELVTMQIQYGDCRPDASAESTFKTAFGGAESVEVEDQARSDFTEQISRCKGFSTDKAICESNTGCKWS